MRISVMDVEQRLKSTDWNNLPEVIARFRQDERKSVIKLLGQYEKKYAAYQMECKRLSEISCYENECYEKGYCVVAGIDEVGRGPLAGPVVTAVVVLKKGASIFGINDSKKLSAKKREALFPVIIEEAVDYAFGIVPPKVIDEINILQATYEAMRQAIRGLKKRPDFVLADAVTIPGIDIPQKGIIKGDSKSISIGAASIIAKVERDRMMREYHALYPEYGFDENKGYGSQKHVEALRKYGLCPIHRRSFLKNIMPMG